ncbi:MAG: hypothetical protein AB1416_05115 [Actinomycetota bacterium]
MNVFWSAHPGPSGTRRVYTSVEIASHYPRWRLLRAEVRHVYEPGRGAITTSNPALGTHPGRVCGERVGPGKRFAYDILWTGSCQAVAVVVQRGTRPEHVNARVAILDTTRITGIDEPFKLSLETRATRTDTSPRLKIKVVAVFCRVVAAMGPGPCTRWVFTDLRPAFPGRDGGSWYDCNDARFFRRTCSLTRSDYTPRGWWQR